jgi:hypothetical protein
MRRIKMSNENESDKSLETQLNEWQKRAYDKFNQNYRITFYFMNGLSEYIICNGHGIKNLYRDIQDRGVRFLIFGDGIGFRRINLDLVYKVDAQEEAKNEV